MKLNGKYCESTNLNFLNNMVVKINNFKLLRNQ